MRLSAFGYTVFSILVAAPILVVASSVWVARRGRFFMADIAAIFLPPVVFFAVGMLREELRTGWALILWPIIIFVVCAYAYSAKAVYLNRRVKNPSRSANIFLLTCMVAAAVAALAVPPWHD